MGMQQWGHFALLSSYKIFLIVVNNNTYKIISVYVCILALVTDKQIASVMHHIML